MLKIVTVTESEKTRHNDVNHRYNTIRTTNFKINFKRLNQTEQESQQSPTNRARHGWSASDQ